MVTTAPFQSFDQNQLLVEMTMCGSKPNADFLFLNLTLR